MKYKTITDLTRRSHDVDTRVNEFASDITKKRMKIHRMTPFCGDGFYGVFIEYGRPATTTKTESGKGKATRGKAKAETGPTA